MENDKDIHAKSAYEAVQNSLEHWERNLKRAISDEPIKFGAKYCDMCQEHTGQHNRLDCDSCEMTLAGFPPCGNDDSVYRLGFESVGYQQFRNLADMILVIEQVRGYIIET